MAVFRYQIYSFYFTLHSSGAFLELQNPIGVAHPSLHEMVATGVRAGLMMGDRGASPTAGDPEPSFWSWGPPWWVPWQEAGSKTPLQHRVWVCCCLWGWGRFLGCCRISRAGCEWCFVFAAFVKIFYCLRRMMTEEWRMCMFKVWGCNKCACTEKLLLYQTQVTETILFTHLAACLPFPPPPVIRQ